MYIFSMKKQVYFTIIGIGAVLAIIGFIPGGMSGIWGILIAGITGVLYYFNKRNEERVQERLEHEQSASEPGASDGPVDVSPTEEDGTEDSDE